MLAARPLPHVRPTPEAATKLRLKFVPSVILSSPASRSLLMLVDVLTSSTSDSEAEANNLGKKPVGELYAEMCALARVSF